MKYCGWTKINRIFNETKEKSMLLPTYNMFKIIIIIPLEHEHSTNGSDESLYNTQDEQLGNVNLTDGFEKYIEK